jgi:hypothetical protein
VVNLLARAIAWVYTVLVVQELSAMSGLVTSVMRSGFERAVLVVLAVMLPTELLAGSIQIPNNKLESEEKHNYIQIPRRDTDGVDIKSPDPSDDLCRKLSSSGASLPSYCHQ